jgi:hypothetical protein
MITSPWYLDEGRPGEGARPDYLKDKYKTVAEQARAYVELEKRFGEAPENYDLGQYTDHVDINNRHLQEFMTHAKQHRITQDGFQKMIGSFVDYDKSQRPDVAKELEKLGADGAKKAEIVDQWAKNILTPTQYDNMAKLPQTAEMVLILDEVRQRMAHERSKTPSDATAGEPFKPITEAEVRSKIRSNPDKYTKDASFREQIRRELEVAVGKG